MLEDSLERLAQMLGSEVPWFLTGGLSIAVAVGVFYRVHEDIDVAIDPDHLGQLVDLAAASSYRLFHRYPTLRVGRDSKIDWYRPVAVAEAVAGSFHLRLVRVDDRGDIHPQRTLLDYVDLHLDRHQPGGTLTGGGRFIPYVRGGVTYRTRSGAFIRCTDPGVQLLLKRRKLPGVDRHDLRMLRGLLRAEGEGIGGDKKTRAQGESGFGA